MSESLNQNFNHLKVHTQYSICEGAAKIDDLQEYCKSNKIKSLGISDTSNLCGALEFAEKISKSGTQPIIGTQINFKLNDITGFAKFFNIGLLNGGIIGFGGENGLTLITGSAFGGFGFTGVGGLRLAKAF